MKTSKNKIINGTTFLLFIVLLSMVISGTLISIESTSQTNPNPKINTNKDAQKSTLKENNLLLREGNSFSIKKSSNTRKQNENIVNYTNNLISNARITNHTKLGLNTVSYGQSNNWGGYVYCVNGVSGSKCLSSNLNNGITEVDGIWNLPAVMSTSSSNEYSSTWIGIGGNDQSGNSLIQAGTNSYVTSAGATTYSAWFEMLPAYQTPVSLTVNPGDSIKVQVLYSGVDGSGNQQWSFFIQDINTTNYWSSTETCNPSTCNPSTFSSADWIMEATNVSNVISQMPAFQRIAFSNDQYVIGSGGTSNFLTSSTPNLLMFFLSDPTYVTGCTNNQVGSYPQCIMVSPSLLGSGLFFDTYMMDTSSCKLGTDYGCYILDRSSNSITSADIGQTISIGYWVGSLDQFSPSAAARMLIGATIDGPSNYECNDPTHESWSTQSPGIAAYGAAYYNRSFTISLTNCPSMPTGTYQIGLGIWYVPLGNSIGSAGDLLLTSTGYTSVWLSNPPLTIYSNPTLTTPSSSMGSTIDLGSTVSFSVTPGGGSGGNTYIWSGLPAGCTSSSSTSITCTPSATGTFSISASVTDSNGGTASGTLSFTVNSALAIGTPTAYPTSGGIDVGQSVTFTSATPSGGTTPYSYTWYNLPSGCVTANSIQITCTPTSSGTFYVYVVVMDSVGISLSSLQEQYIIDSAPSVSLNTNPGSIDLQGTVTFSASASGGTGSYSYSWSGLPTGCSSSNSYQIFCTPTVANSYSVQVTVTDAHGITATRTTPFTVYPQLSLTNPTASVLSGGIDVNQPVKFTSATASGGTGTGTYTYGWTSLPTGCSNSGAITVTCNPTAAGTFTISVTVIDSNGYTATGTISFIVHSDPSVGVPTASVASGGIDIGQTVTFTSPSASGGVAPYSYSWTGLPTGCTDSGTTVVTCTPTGSGTFNVQVIVHDSNNYGISSSYLTYIVYVDPSAGSITPSGADIGQSVAFAVPITGGSGGFSYSWTGLPSSCSSSNVNPLSCQPTVSGTYYISVTVTDSNGKSTVSSTLTFTVNTDPTVGQPLASVSSGNIDVGQSITFTSAIPTGGGGGYTYKWISLPNGCSDSGSSTINCMPSAAGTFNVIINVTDANGFTITSPTLQFIIQSQPVIGLFSSTPSSIDLSQNTTFSVTASGGSGTYSYTWYGLPTSCNSANTNSLYCKPTINGTYSVYVSIQDSNGFVFSSTTISFIVYDDPTVATPTASLQSGSIDANQAITFTSGSVTGGSGGNAYSWIGLPSGCSNSGISTLSCSPTVSGSFNIAVTITDSNGYSVTSNSLPFTIVSDPTVGTPTASKTSGGIDIGQSITFTSAIPTGGVAPYNYQWSALPTGCVNSGSSSVTCSPTGSGTFNIAMSITDANGYVVTSNSLSFVVNPDVSIGALSPTTADVGQSISITSSIVGGSGIYSYSWGGLPTGCSSANSIPLTCNPSTTGIFSVTLSVTDSNGFSTTSNPLTFTVYSDPTVGIPTATVSSGGIDVGQSVTFTTGTITGGLSPYSYNWTGLPIGCSNSATTTDICNPTAAGSYSVGITITDANGFVVSSSKLTFIVDSQPQVGVPAGTPTSVDLSQSTSFSSVITGGSGGYTYAWNNLPTGCSSTNVNPLPCTPTTTGAYSISLTITDSNGYSVTSSPFTFIIYTIPIVAVPTAFPTSPDAGQNVSLSVSVNGGSGGYIFSWMGLPSGCVSSNVNPLNCMPTITGTYTVSVSVTDSNGYNVSSNSLSVVVYSKLLVGTPTSSSSSSNIDLGQTTTFSVSAASGGLGPYTYNWQNLPNGCTDSGTTTVSCTPTSTGSSNIIIVVSDANGNSVQSNTLVFTVFSDPSVGTPTAATGSIDLSQSTNFSSSISGGSGSYTYSWTNLPMGCSSANVNPISCTPTVSGTYSVTLSVTDSNGYTISSGTLSFIVYSDPTVGTPTATPVSGGIDAGQSVTFTSASPANGLSPYIYSWSGLPAGCSISTGSSISCTPSSAGTYTVSVIVTDANGYQVSSVGLTFVVQSQPIVGTLTSSSSSVDLSQSTSFTGSVTGGSGSYSYSWNGLPSGCSSVNFNMLQCTPTGTGTYTIKLTVTDSNGYAVTSSSLTFKIYSDPVVSDTTPSTADVGQNISINAVVTGGSGSFSYTWNNLPTGCVTSSRNPIYCIPTQAGTYTLSVTVVDSNGFSISSNSVTFNVSSSLVVSTPTASPVSGGIDVGQSVNFTDIAPNGGLAPYSYSWNGLPAGCSNSGSLTVFCSPTSSGTYNITLSVSDANGNAVQSKNLKYTVNSQPSVANLTETRSTVDVTQSTSLSIDVSGGSGTYTYTWNGLPSGCSSLNLNPLPCTANSVGIYSISVSVTDSNGDTDTSTTISLIVYSDPTIGNVTASAVSGGIDVGQQVIFTSGSVSGGSGTYNYTWNGLPNGCSSSNQNKIRCTPLNAGTYVIIVSVTDTNQYTVSSSDFSFTVKSLPTVTSPSPSTSTGLVGTSVIFSTTVSGGSGNINYEWISSSPNLGCSISNSNALTCTPTAPGKYTVNVTVTDSNGGSSSAVSAIFNVSAVTTSTYQISSQISTSVTSTGGNNGVSSTSSKTSESLTSSTKVSPGFTSIMIIISLFCIGEFTIRKKR